MTGAMRQVAALLRLRWQMARTPGVRFALVLGAVALAYLVALVIGTAEDINPIALATAIDVAPLAFLGFGALAFIAPLTAGGGNVVVPPDQVVAFPVRPKTLFLGGLLLAPLNLVWVVQLLSLVALTSYLSFGGGLLPAFATTGSYVVCITVLGQALAWTVVGLRQTLRGRWAVVGMGVLTFAVGAAVVRGGQGRELVDSSPVRFVPRAISAGALGNYGTWFPTTAALALLALVGYHLGSRACDWALRRPGDLGTHRRTEPVRRRATRGGPLRQLVGVDRASVWRAPALRRGGIVLVVLPGVLAAGAQVPWASLVVLPGLVAAGAGLLFGVNVFCLDASGAVWLASLPHDPVLAFRSKAIVLTETVLAAVVIAAVTGSLRSPGSPTGPETAAILASGIASTAVVVAVGLKASVRRPHRADLAGPRDAAAPPGALALASARLAIPTAILGIVLGSASKLDVWWLPVALAVPPLLLCGLSINRSLQLWKDPLQRARIVHVVAAG